MQNKFSLNQATKFLYNLMLGVVIQLGLESFLVWVNSSLDISEIEIISKNNRLFHNLIEIDIRPEQVVLIGCLSCFDHAVKQMNDIINRHMGKHNGPLYYHVREFTYEYDEQSFIKQVEEAYFKRRKEFKKTFDNCDLLTTPDEFYPKYLRHTNPFHKVLDAIQKKFLK